MTINCQINLKRVAPVFYNGERVAGNISLATRRKHISVEAIRITLLGKGEVTWSELRPLHNIEHNDSTISGCNRRATLNYKGSQYFVNEVLELSEGSLQLLPGQQYNYDFEFELPMELPATCKLPHGQISYELIVSLERKAKHAKLFKQRLTLKNRIELEDYIRFCPISETGTALTLNTTRCAYVPGQRVDYQLTLANQAYAYPPKFAVRLCQCVEYWSTQPEMKVKRVVRVLDSQRQLIQGSLHIPLTSPIMTVYGGELLVISYYLELVATDVHKTICERMVLPLYLGTVTDGSSATLVQEDLQNAESEHCCFVNMGNTMLSLPSNSESSSSSSLSSLSSTVKTSGYSKENLAATKTNSDRNKLLQLKRRNSHIKTVLNLFY